MDALEPRAMLAAVFWDGGGGDGNWSNPLNWSADVLPGAADDVTIDVPASNPTITHGSGSHSIRSLLSNERVDLTGGTITLGTASRTNGPLSMLGGHLAGAGDLEVAGVLNWSAGEMRGSGRTVVMPTGTLNIAGNFGTTTAMINRNLTNNGTVNWNSGDLRLANGTVLNTGFFNTRASGGSLIDLGTNLFDNRGVFRRALGAPANSVTAIVVPFVNTGVVDVQTGSLFLDGGGSNNATMAAQSGAVLQMNNGFTHLNGATYTGAGSTRFVAGTHTFSGRVNFYSGNTEVPTAATIAVATGTNAIFAGTLNLRAGTLQLAGQTTIIGILNVTGGIVTGAADLTIFSSTTNLARLNWFGGNMQGPGRTLVFPGGIFNILGDVSTTRRTVNNATTNFAGGTLTLTNTSFFNVAGKPFNANGTATVRTGGGGLFENAGNFNKNNPNTVSFNGVSIHNTGTITVNGGTLNLNHGGNSPGGYVVGAGATLNYAGAFTSSGALTVGAGANFNVNGNFVQTSTGTITILLGGAAPSLYGRISAVGGATLGGRLNTQLVNGFTLQSGQNFSILTAASRTGTFTQVPGAPLNTVYLPTGVRLTVS